MRLGPFELLLLLPLIIGLVWVIYELMKKPPVTDWDAQKRELQHLRKRLAELQIAQSEPYVDPLHNHDKGEGG